MREAKAVYLIGDVNYLEHGGMIVFEDGSAEIVNPGEEEGEVVTIHRLQLERVAQPSREWYGNKLSAVARSVDVPVHELVAGLQSENLEDRAESYHDLLLYWGSTEFDQHPITLTTEEAEKRYADVDEQLGEARRRQKAQRNPSGPQGPTKNCHYNVLLVKWAESGHPSKPECEECGANLTGRDVWEEDAEGTPGWFCSECADQEESEDDPDYNDRDDFADPGGRSALRAAGPRNPRDQRCPTCGWPDRLTRRDVELGYQCDRCGDAIEQGREINYYEGDEDEEPEEEEAEEEAEPNQPSQAGMGSGPFTQDLLSLLEIGDRQVRIRKGGHDTVFVNFINLPQGVGGAGGGAEAENNRVMFMVSGFGRESEVAPPPTGKVKVEMRVSALPRSYNLRAKTGTPSAIARYLADHLKRVASEVPPHFTHTARENPGKARRSR